MLLILTLSLSPEAQLVLGSAGRPHPWAQADGRPLLAGPDRHLVRLDVVLNRPRRRVLHGHKLDDLLQRPGGVGDVVLVLVLGALLASLVDEGLHLPVVHAAQLVILLLGNVRHLVIAVTWTHGVEILCDWQYRWTNDALQRKSHLCIPRKVIARPQSQFPHSCVCGRFIYSQERSKYFPAE